MDRFVKLDKPPAGLEVPPDLSERFRYDESRFALVHDGFMSKLEFDRLSQLCDDWSYKRSLEELFRLCSTDSDDDRPPGWKRLLGVLGAKRSKSSESGDYRISPR